MAKKILITGGAGFIGTHLTRELTRHGHTVRILDAYEPQVHKTTNGGVRTDVPEPRTSGIGGRPTTPLSAFDPTRHGQGSGTGGATDRTMGDPYATSPVETDTDADVETIHGDVRDPTKVREALRDIDIVYHLAAKVGVGQSMYQVRDYLDANTIGTAVLLEAIAERPVDRLVVASSMSVYGEGLYQTQNGSPVLDAERKRPSQRHGWDPLDDRGRPLEPVPTPESKPPGIASVYALSKYDQERLCLVLGEAYDVPTTALRFFNVYGAGQALHNPYTGVLAIFAAQIMNDRRPTVFEDGRQTRDFVHVSDVVRACRLAADAPEAVGQAINIGSGQPRTVYDAALALTAALGRDDIRPKVTHKFRQGDVRHCFADVSLARRILRLEDQVPLETGIREWVEWLRHQETEDHTETAGRELMERGLLR